MHDPTSLFRFDEHDIYLPMITLEELDGHKRGMTEVARNARQVSRDLDALAANMPSARRRRPERRPAAQPHRPPRGRRQALLPDQPGRRRACRPGCRRARPTTRSSASCRRCASSSKARDVVLVSKDINMRIKARALGPAGRGLLQRQDARRRRPALHRRAAAAGRLLGAPRQDDGELAAGRPHLLPHQRADGAGAARSTSSSTSRRRAPRRSTPRSPRSPARPRCCAR